MTSNIEIITADAIKKFTLNSNDKAAIITYFIKTITIKVSNKKLQGNIEFKIVDLKNRIKIKE